MVQKEFLKLCKKGEVQGGFLFYGPEEYTKLHCLKTLRKSLFGEEEDLFNHLKLSAQTSGLVGGAVSTGLLFADVCP